MHSSPLSRDERIRRLSSSAPTLSEVLAERAKRDLARWCRFVDDSYVVAKHHRQLINALERVERGECKRLIVSMPPRHGKSLTSTIRFPAWWLGRNPDKRVIIAAHTASLAYSFSRRCRNEFTQYGPEVFGVRVAEDSSAVDHWSVADRRGGLVAAGVGGPIAGQGADLLVIDDPVKDAEAALSEIQRTNSIEWYRSTARTRLHPGGAIVVVMTRWHEADLAGALLQDAKSGGEQWEEVVLPMLSGDTEILWPERYSPEEVEGLRRTVGAMWWSALYQQRPAPAEGALFKKEWFKFYRKHELPPKWDEQLLSWDCSFKDSAGSDFVSGQVWGRLGARKFLLERVHARMDAVRTLSEFEAQVARWPEANAKLVEEAANGYAVIQLFRNRIPGLIAVRPEGSKLSRAHAVAPTVEAGDVYLPHPHEAPWVDDFLAELCSFPTAPHDDDVDAMSQALRRLNGEARVPKLSISKRPRVEM
jgi:predicted phage terminase large subunit-like protein